MRAKGSITVFAALALMLVASFLFALLEAGRMRGLSVRAELVSQLSLESVCAEYQTGLWEKYHLLCLDGAYGEDAFSMEYVSSTLNSRAKRNLSGENSLFRMVLEDAEPIEYQLLTDGDGSVFLKRVSEYMKENLTTEAAGLIYEKYLQGSRMEQENAVGDCVEAAQKAIDDAKKQMEQEGTQESTQEGAQEGTQESTLENAQAKGEANVENPLEIVLKIKQNAVLSLVLGDISELSAKEVDLSDGLLKRECLKGTAAEEEEAAWYEKVLALEYLDGYFLDYTEPSEEHALEYEMEYVLCGKESDAANLESVVKRLLLVREAANAAHILANTDKKEEALMVASALAGFTGNPAIIDVVQIGVIAAWAYMESLLDVRALLSGDKIALIKSDAQWTVQTGNLMESFERNTKAKNCENGLSYQSYLKQFLFFVEKDKLAYRMMDIMEQNLRLVPGYQNCRMDYMICKMSCKLQYSAKPLFADLTVLGRLNTQYLKFCETTQFSYY